ncbi:MAG: hypothetical protein BGP15_02375 [Sphingobacterium sp. 40-24]|nr:MAG: hypothetical protein BGP15_02375 [Sphingobacterium sp. 40-24]
MVFRNVSPIVLKTPILYKNCTKALHLTENNNLNKTKTLTHSLPTPINWRGSSAAGQRYCQQWLCATKVQQVASDFVHIAQG